MRILDAGHRYEADGFDGGGPQYIQFFKRVGPKFPFNAGTPLGGTNCQEILRILIDRVDYLQRQNPCAESEAISALLKTALMLFETRAARRRDQTLVLADLMACVRGATCSECGHINCQDHAALKGGSDG